MLVTQTCDYEHPEGETAAEEREPRRFAWDGQEYEIDLCGTHGEKYDEVFGEWAGRARAAEPIRAERAPRVARRRQAAGSPESRQHNSQIREWAKRSGIFVADRGRIPADVVSSYEKATEAP